MMDFLAVIVAGFLGALAQGMTGIGFAVVYVSICSFALTYMTSLISMKFLGLLFSLPIIIKYKSKIRWKYVFLPLIFSFVGNAGALYLLKLLDETLLTMILGIVLFITGIANLVFKKEWHFKGGVFSSAFVGILMGFLAGICGMSGPVLALYFLGIDELVEDKDCYFATAVTLFQLMGVYQLIILAVDSVIPPDTYKYVLAGIVPVLGGMTLGLKQFENANVSMIKLFLNCFMLVMGIFLFISNLVKL